MKVVRVILIGLLWVGVLPMRAEMSPEREAQFYYDFYAAQKAINDGQYARAFCLFHLCAQINPTDGRTQDYLGLMYDALHQTDSAKACFARAYESAPNELYQHHVGSLMSQGRIKEALVIMKSATKVNEDDADAWNLLLQVAMANEDYPIAEKAITKVEEHLGPSPYGILIRYQIAIQKGKIKKAMGYLDEYLEFIPDNPTILNDYAYLLATHKGDLNRAEQMSAKAIQMQPENASFLDTYGWILHLKGQDSLALFYLNKALKLSKDVNEKNIIQQHIEKAK